MSNRAAAFAACLALAMPTHAGAPLTLEHAVTRVFATHPDLRTFAPLRLQREAERVEALIPPPRVVGMSLENALGTGDARLLTGMELTLSLGSVLERPDKPAARAAVAAGQRDALGSREAAIRLDLVTETAQRHLDIVRTQRMVAIAEVDVAQRRHAAGRALERVQAGAAPASEHLAAEAAHARARLALARLAAEQAAARRRLATLWGEPESDVEIAPMDPFALPEAPVIARLEEGLDRAPDLASYADEQRVREALLQLARTAKQPDLAWEVGVRRIEATDDVALVGSVSLPIGTHARAAAGIDAARASLDALAAERASRSLSLRSAVRSAHARYASARVEALALQQEVVPSLVRAAGAAEQAYRAGAATYQAWAQIQADRVDALRQGLDGAVAAHRALIELQRLTGLPLVTRIPQAITTRTDDGATP